MPRAMSARLQKYAQIAGLAERIFTVHSFRVGAAVTRTIAGQNVDAIMASIGWKSKRMAHRHIGGAIAPRVLQKHQKRQEKRTWMRMNLRHRLVRPNLVSFVMHDVIANLYRLHYLLLQQLPRRTSADCNSTHSDFG